MTKIGIYTNSLKYSPSGHFHCEFDQGNYARQHMQAKVKGHLILVMSLQLANNPSKSRSKTAVIILFRYDEMIYIAASNHKLLWHSPVKNGLSATLSMLLPLATTNSGGL